MPTASSGLPKRSGSFWAGFRANSQVFASAGPGARRVAYRPRCQSLNCSGKLPCRRTKVWSLKADVKVGAAARIGVNANCAI